MGDIIYGWPPNGFDTRVKVFAFLSYEFSQVCKLNPPII